MKHFESYDYMVEKIMNEKYSVFYEELRSLINRLNLENDSDTPDYILAEFLVGCLKQFNATAKDRDRHKS